MNALFPRLAAVNLRNNKTAYLPFLLTGNLCVAMFYIILTFAISPEMAAVPYATGAVALFLLGTVIIAVFCTVLLFYANGFLIRRRKREFGLYSVLGMEKRHVGVVLLFESLYTCAACLILGLISGTLLGRILFSVLTRLLSFDVSFDLSFCETSAAASCIVFGFLFSVLYLYNLIHLYNASPITLLHSDQIGEREPHASWLLTLGGLISLGAGYFIAVTCHDAARSITQFFLAVLLVILGTFCLFTSGSIHLLKALRRSAKFYYRPENFISVSGMLYRMKRNAAGLASICILFTMLLVTVSTTVCLYLGQESSLNTMYPTDIVAAASDSSEGAAENMRAAAEDAAQASGTEIEALLSFRTASASLQLHNGTLVPRGASGARETDPVWYATILPLTDYTSLTGDERVLGVEDCLIYSPALSSTTQLPDGLRIAGKASLPESLAKNAAAGNSVWFVAADAESLSHMLGGGTLNVNLFLDVQGDENAQHAFAAALEQTGTISYVFCRADIAHDWYALYGCFLFLGLFFGVLFLVAVGLILYYKQLSEGIDDQTRFVIMQKVGLSRAEARRAIRRQILLVFFLPLVAAALHMVFAYQIICNILTILGVTDRVLFAVLCAATFLVCTVVYFGLYHLTSRACYKLVDA